MSNINFIMPEGEEISIDGAFMEKAVTNVIGNFGIDEKGRVITRDFYRLYCKQAQDAYGHDKDIDLQLEDLGLLIYIAGKINGVAEAQAEIQRAVDEEAHKYYDVLKMLDPKKY